MLNEEEEIMSAYAKIFRRGLENMQKIMVGDEM
jgi:hypothetical protein